MRTEGGVDLQIRIVNNVRCMWNRISDVKTGLVYHDKTLQLEIETAIVDRLTDGATCEQDM